MIDDYRFDGESDMYSKREQLKRELLGLDIMVPGRVKRTDGTMGDVYYDIKKAYGNPQALNMMADMIYELFPESVSCVASFGHGGIPIASAISSRHNMPLAILREQFKDHGLKKWIEGYHPKRGDKVAVVDDITITRKSLDSAVDLLERVTEADIVGCYVVVKESDLDMRSDPTYPLKHLLETRELLEGYYSS